MNTIPPWVATNSSSPKSSTSFANHIRLSLFSNHWSSSPIRRNISVIRLLSQKRIGPIVDRFYQASWFEWRSRWTWHELIGLIYAALMKSEQICWRPRSHPSVLLFDCACLSSCCLSALLSALSCFNDQLSSIHLFCPVKWDVCAIGY